MNEIVDLPDDSSTDTKIRSGRPRSRADSVATTTTAAAPTAVAATATAVAATAAEAAATTAATTTEATAATTAAAAATRAALFGDVDAKAATLEVLTVEVLDRLLGTFGGGHLHEAEAAGLAGHPIQHERHFADFAASRKTLRDEILSGVEREITDVQTIRHETSSLCAAFENFRQAPTSRTEGEVTIALYENAARV
jgi:hypothetical protein